SAAEAAILQEIELLPSATVTEEPGVPVGPEFAADVLASPFHFFTSASADANLDVWATSSTDSHPRFMVDQDGHGGLAITWSDPGSPASAGAVAAPAAIQQSQLMSTVSALEFYAGLTPITATGSLAAPVAGSASDRTTSDVLAASPLSFEPNVGQTDSRVHFLARGAGYTLFLTPTEAVLSLQRLSNSPTGVAGPGESAVIRMDLVGGNPNAAVVSQDEQPGRVNYYVGNDPSQWHTDVATYGRVAYQGVYPGVNLVYYSNAQNNLEYDFV